MSKLNVDQKNIYELLSDRKADYIIPDYQRPYAWDEDNWQTHRTATYSSLPAAQCTQWRTQG